MWNRRKEDETAPRPAVQNPPPPSTLAREGIPVNPLPPRAAEMEGARAASIGKSVVIKGDLFSREDLYIDGEVHGTVEMPESRVTIGPNGRLQASIKAREIVVVGAVHGNVEAGERIEIRKDAKLVGDIKTVRVVIEDGAFFKGSIDIQRHEAKPQPRAAAAAAASQGPGTAQPQAPPGPGETQR